MSSPRPYESDLLAPAEHIVRAFAARHVSRALDARLQLLEAAASRLGGFWLDAFFAQFGVDPIAPPGALVQESKAVVEAIDSSGIHPALALSALSREPLNDSSRRTTGAYHTDFRLATRLAELAASRLRPGARVIDPACGAGMLLVALSIQACGRDRKKMGRWLADSVCAADTSPVARRGALLALASLTSDLGALAAMHGRWVLADSLLAPESVWRSLAPEGFDVVIGNPPWEKVKLTRHEYLKSRGHERHYGAHVAYLDQVAFAREKSDVTEYARQLVERFPGLTNGEPDLYVAFTTLFERLCRPGGVMAVLVPAGLIRSQGTEPVRRHLIEVCERVSVSVIENRARFFSIDTRFKFLAIACIKATANNARRAPITLLHERGVPGGLEQFGAARIGRDSLATVRADLSLPEVRNNREWRIFRRMVASGVPWQEPGSGWRPVFCREVDMTRERAKFITKPGRNRLPVVEGRMVQQHRFGPKGYVSGSGRRAVWEGYPLGSARLQSQFHISIEDVPWTSRSRINVQRGGFCDITGQTNERSLMAALIPPGVVCGNKVPTVLFPDDPSEDRLLVWCAVMNSLPFDWMLRRIITTTVNYFLLLSVPMPRLAADGLPWRRLRDAAHELRKLDAAGESDFMRAAVLRSEIDAELAVAYRLCLDDLVTIAQDFPLLDRGQPPLPHESRSTITTDMMLAAAAKRMKKSTGPWAARVEEALRIGARAYVPSEFSGVVEVDEQGAVNGGY